jgi:hypothetical protein
MFRIYSHSLNRGSLNGISLLGQAFNSLARAKAKRLRLMTLIASGKRLLLSQVCCICAHGLNPIQVVATFEFTLA